MPSYEHRSSNGDVKGRYEGNKMSVNNHNLPLVEILGDSNVTTAVIHLLPGDAVYLKPEQKKEL